MVSTGGHRRSMTQPEFGVAQIQAFRSCRRWGIAIGFATLRAQSMKSCAAGINVRFFNVMIQQVHSPRG
jgi:hypothetical protein